MELRILTPMEKMRLPEVKWNNEELKAEIAARVSEFNATAYTDKDVKDMKADRATINKLISAFEGERKSYKKFYMAPYEKFEKEVKDVLEPAISAEKILAVKIKEVDDQRRLEKKEKIMDYYHEIIGNLKGILPFIKVFKDEYLNASKTMKSIQEEMLALVESVNTDLDTIEGFNTKHELQIKDVYIRTLDLSAAMREKARLEDVERRLGERRAKEQAERDALIELQKQKDGGSEENNVAETIPPVKETVEIKEEPLLQMDFRVFGTREQLMAVRQFMIDNKIKFGKVE